MEPFIINDETVAPETIALLEKTYGITCIPGNYWYDKLTGAFGLKGGPCAGVGIAGLQLGGTLKAGASGALGTQVFINMRELHPADVQALQAFIPVLPGRYWMDAAGNFGYEGLPVPVGNLHQLYRMKSAASGNSSYYKSNPWSGETKSFGSDGSFMYYSAKKSDGTSIDYFTG